MVGFLHAPNSTQKRVTIGRRYDAILFMVWPMKIFSKQVQKREEGLQAPEQETHLSRVRWRCRTNYEYPPVPFNLHFQRECHNWNEKNVHAMMSPMDTSATYSDGILCIWARAHTHTRTHTHAHTHTHTRTLFFDMSPTLILQLPVLKTGKKKKKQENMPCIQQRKVTCRCT